MYQHFGFTSFYPSIFPITSLDFYFFHSLFRYSCSLHTCLSSAPPSARPLRGARRKTHPPLFLLPLLSPAIPVWVRTRRSSSFLILLPSFCIFGVRLLFGVVVFLRLRLSILIVTWLKLHRSKGRSLWWVSFILVFCFLSCGDTVVWVKGQVIILTHRWRRFDICV